MTDKSWMMNTKAISAAKKCVSIVEAELGIRLKLANPDFLELLIQYAELNDSQELERAVLVLAQYAPADVRGLLPINGANDENHRGSGATTTEAEPVVSYKGRSYPRYRDGGEFKGLYRGQPRYA